MSDAEAERRRATSFAIDILELRLRGEVELAEKLRVLMQESDMWAQYFESRERKAA